MKFQDESSIPLGRRSSNSSREQEHDPDQDQDQPMEPNQNWVEQVKEQEPDKEQMQEIGKEQ